MTAGSRISFRRSLTQFIDCGHVPEFGVHSGNAATSPILTTRGKAQPVPSPLFPLVDRFGRVHTDLRVSLTDRCNLRCTYCMPAEGLAWLPRAEVLTDDEVVRLVRIAIRRLGITKIRLTGGEPLLRRGLPGLVARLSGLDPTLDLSLTTNGIGLARSAAALREAGLRRVNVSLDTLRPERYAAITRRDRLTDVLEGLRAAGAAGLAPIKVNAVLVRDVNDDEIADLAAFAVEHGYRMRFIESMPLDAQEAWDRDRMISAEEILNRLGNASNSIRSADRITRLPRNGASLARMR
jgi:GTP 3',8-cyclase